MHLTFALRDGVKWHDGAPFSAKDVQCTWDMLLGRSSEKLRTNPRTSWYRNLDRVTADSDHEATFHLKRPQPAFIAFLASGFSPVYPCHVSPRDMRQARSAVSRRHRVHDYKKPRDRNPRLHRWQVRYDLSLPGYDSLNERRENSGAGRDLRAQAKQRQKHSAHKPQRPPFDNPDLRRAMALNLEPERRTEVRVSQNQSCDVSKYGFSRTTRRSGEYRRIRGRTYCPGATVTASI